MAVGFESPATTRDPSAKTSGWQPPDHRLSVVRFEPGQRKLPAGGVPRLDDILTLLNHGSISRLVVLHQALGKVRNNMAMEREQANLVVAVFQIAGVSEQLLRVDSVPAHVVGERQLEHHNLGLFGIR